MGYDYSSAEYKRPFHKGEYITLTRGNGINENSAPWIIGIVAKDWNPVTDDDVYLLADYKFHGGCGIPDDVEIYEKPDCVCPYFEGWRRSTYAERFLMDSALALTGHKFNPESNSFHEITTCNRITLDCNLSMGGQSIKVEQLETEE